jgi:hypothetical protein
MERERADGMVLVASSGDIEALVTSHDCSNYQMYVKVKVQGPLTKQQRADLLAFALEIHDAFQDKAGVPSTECCFYSRGAVGVSVRCYGKRLEYVPGVALESAECEHPWQEEGIPWTQHAITAMRRFLRSALPMFLFGMQDYGGRVRVVLIPAGMVSAEDASLLKARGETIAFWGQGPAMTDGEDPQGSWAKCLEKYCLLLDGLVPGATQVLSLDPDYTAGTAVAEDWWQRAIDATQGKNVVDRACIRYVRVADPQ